MTADAADYLNQSELRELAEIESDRQKIRRALHDLSMRKQLIKNRAATRRDRAAIKLHKVAGPDGRVVL